MSTANETVASNMPHGTRACDLWTQLDMRRQSMMQRLEKLAGYTLPHLLIPDGWQADEDGNTHDYQSVGAQCVNHLATKLMLTMFAPTRPFMRLDPTRELRMAAKEAGFPLSEVENVLAQAEREAVRELDAMAARPKLFELLKQLIALGNSLLVFPEDEKDDPRVLNIKRFVVKRSLDTKLHTLVIREVVKKDELSQAAQTLVSEKSADSDCHYYILVQRTDRTKYKVSHWVDEHELVEKRDDGIEYEDLRYRVIAWNLADYADYGTGLCEEYMGALSGLSTLSVGIIRGAILASEFRWLANPAGMTSPEDFNNSKNGECLPGQEGDVTLVQAAAEVARAVDVARSVAQDYVNTLGRGFLMTSAMTRDAERVTAEEIRMLASELETGLGGAYSRLAVDVQLPLGRFLLKRIKVTFRDQEIKPSIVTGLDALSRNGDLEALRAYLSDVASITSLPEPVLRYLPLDTILQDLATGRGLDGKRYSRTQDTASQAQAAEDQRQVAVENATAAGEAQAKAAAQGASDA